MANEQIACAVLNWFGDPEHPWSPSPRLPRDCRSARAGGRLLRPRSENRRMADPGIANSDIGPLIDCCMEFQSPRFWQAHLRRAGGLWAWEAGAIWLALGSAPAWRLRNRPDLNCVLE